MVRARAGASNQRTRERARTRVLDHVPRAPRPLAATPRACHAAPALRSPTHSRLSIWPPAPRPRAPRPPAPRPRRRRLALAATALVLAGCGALEEDEVPLGDPEPRTITHAFGELALPPLEDNARRCVSWRLDNERALYVQSVQLANEGSFHHSNWLVVPEDSYPGADGFWDCDARGFEEVSAAQKGTVLFAQSTQSYDETQRLADGAVIKIPPRHKIVGLLHTLNAAPRETRSRLWLSLELIHPRAVTTVVTPLSMQYKALDIPGERESRFTGNCDLSLAHSALTFEPLDLRLHYILPHYHYLGNYFDVQVVGGAMDGQSVYRLEGFNGEGNGRTFDPPLELPGATGLKFTCGYDNWRDQRIRWGNGEGEMCVMLALVEAGAVMGSSVDAYNHIVAVEDGIYYNEGLCLTAAAARSPQQGPPTGDERRAPMYLPPVDPADEELPPVPACVDVDPAAPAEAPATLSSVRDALFTPSCSFSACHGETIAGGLDLHAADLHAELLGHEVAGADLPLIEPGDPDNSWLYRVLSRCEPTDDAGGVGRHMPLNAPFLLDAAVVNKVRAWIAAGAKDN